MANFFNSKPEVVPYDATATVNPPGFSQPYLGNQFATVGNAPGSTPYNQQQNQAIQGGGQAAMQFGPVVDPALQYYQNTLQGQYLQPDVLRQAADPYIDQFAPQVLGQYALQGRSGSPAAGLAFGRGVGDIIAQQYQTERGRQQQMAQLAPQFQDLRLDPYKEAFGFGELARQEGQQSIAGEQQKLASLAGAADPFSGVTNESLFVEGGGNGLLDLLGGSATGIAFIDDIMKRFGSDGLSALLGGGADNFGAFDDILSGGPGGAAAGAATAAGNAGGGSVVGSVSDIVAQNAAKAAAKKGLGSLFGGGAGDAFGGAVGGEFGGLASGGVGSTVASALGATGPGAVGLGAGAAGPAGVAADAALGTTAAGGGALSGLGITAGGAFMAALPIALALMDNSVGAGNPAARDAKGRLMAAKEGQPLPSGGDGTAAKWITLYEAGGTALDWGRTEMEEGEGSVTGNPITILNPKIGENVGTNGKQVYIPKSFLVSMQSAGFPDLNALSKLPGNLMPFHHPEEEGGPAAHTEFVPTQSVFSPSKWKFNTDNLLNTPFQNLTLEERADYDRELSSTGQ